MKQLVSTKLVRTLQTASQNGANIDAHTLENDYDDFVKIVFAENADTIDKSAFRQMLVYTRVELLGFTEVSEKKRRYLPFTPLPHTVQFPPPFPPLV